MTRFVSFAFFLITSIFFAQSTQASAELRSECLFIDNLPSNKKCTGQFFIRTSNDTFSEQFLLSLNDPIEYFHYQSRYTLSMDTKKNQVIFARLPILGYTRDQFIDSNPYSDSLLFSVNIAGIGYWHHWGFAELSMDSNLIYLKQRYAPNYVHSDVPIDPEKNQVYDFAGYGFLNQASLALNLPFNLSMIASALRIYMKSEGSWYQDFENSLEAKWSFFQNKDLKTGISARNFIRHNGLRHDQGIDTFALSRVGLFVEFL